MKHSKSARSRRSSSLSRSRSSSRSPAFMRLARFSSETATLGASLAASLRAVSSRGLLIGALVASVAALAPPAAFAQNDDTPPALDTNSGVKAPATPSSQVGKLTLDQQVKWLRAAQQSGAMEKLDDAQLVALFQSLDPLALPRYIKEGPNGFPSYEFTMSRSERIHGQWPDKPDHMLVRIAHDPLRIYAKWLPDGAHAGQEIIYDESKRTDEMYGHLGGIMNVMPLWTALNGALARAQSNHQVRDLGTEYIAGQYLSECKKYIEAGIPRSNQVEVKTIDGVRVVAFTFETPNGPPQFYAKKETLGLDLRHPYFRTVESYDNDGKIFEKIVFESITPKTLDDSTFDPKNKAYKF
ncbi:MULTISPECIES: DUF1571 domain-containing protein [Paraburkholderia]|uniref:DUF1571 domain-containing protein n=1 Tax=Paraburkholderia madseniana TaxID=2599607 RepID=A0AAP5BDQ4_9BURK|nr:MULTISPECIES: DUF1571 domain-containing protein [Paraburkholderia]MCX4146383.1 DUF1571 domain-containing protein [Paraburkholderia madseniana]MDN7149329.1 DUF1571 domain-containing protein [Paraburkholderia sp. WS6]MDQ6408209.1 DUF1571 domain-containing protein [Paraburkholderia madseniana]